MNNGLRVRQAERPDVQELVRLRHAMFRAMAAAGAAARPEVVNDSSWYRAAGEAVEQRMADGTLAAFVVDAAAKPSTSAEAGRPLVACAVGTLTRRLPGPGFARGLSGLMSSVFVEPAHRGQGLARAVVSACLSWLDARGAEVIDVHATPNAERLYRSLGFSEPHSLALRRLGATPPRH